MPDYIYLLANRLSPSQQNALQLIRDAAREASMTVFLTGGAVRDLTSGSPVRDLDVSVQGNALNFKKRIEDAGAVLWGEHEPSQTLFARFPGSVRVELSSTRREEFPKPGKPVYHPASILEDLRRRDFTVNAMALSLNDGSYGLLMDPLNGVADLEARQLRLVSNYGFLEDPIRMVRAARLAARLGWELEERTKTRFENAREEGVIAEISVYQQGYEVEEIVHEEDGLKILTALEADGWMKHLFPAWTSGKADVEGLAALREALVQLQMQGVNPDPSAAQAELLTAKLAAKDVAALKRLFPRHGFVREWETQEERAKEVAKQLLSKDAAAPSAAWKLLTSVDPEAVLWLSQTSKNAGVQAKFKDFFTVWPEARQRIPYVLMQEMRIVPELEGYQDLLKAIFFQLIDGKLTTDDELRAFLEPYSPPAPPPPVTIRRTRAKKSADKARELREAEEDDEPSDRRQNEDEDLDGDEDLEDEGADEVAEIGLRRSTPVHVETPAPPPVIAPAAKPEPMAVVEPVRPAAAVVPVAEAKQPAPPPDVSKPSTKKAAKLDVEPQQGVVTAPVKERSIVESPKGKAVRSEAQKASVADANGGKSAEQQVAKVVAKPAVVAESKPAPAAATKGASKPVAKPAVKVPVKVPVRVSAKAPSKPAAKAPVKGLAGEGVKAAPISKVLVKGKAPGKPTVAKSAGNASAKSKLKKAPPAKSAKAIIKTSGKTTAKAKGLPAKATAKKAAKQVLPKKQAKKVAAKAVTKAPVKAIGKAAGKKKR